MPRYLIRREIPGAGAMNSGELHAASQALCPELQCLGARIRWVQSFVTGNTLHCVYTAPDESVIREHARRAGFPDTEVMEIKAVIADDGRGRRLASGHASKRHPQSSTYALRLSNGSS